jgi:protease I
MKKVFIISGIVVAIILVGFLFYKTLVNYLGLLGEKATPSNPESGQPADSSATSTGQTIEVGNQLGGQGEVIVTPALENKSIAVIIAFSDFRDEEFFPLRNLFMVSGSKVTVVSTDPGQAQSSGGNNVPVEILLKDLQVKDFDAVVFIGGSGALADLDNQDAYRVAIEAVNRGKVLAAICVSPEILAKAGVLAGKKATVWTSQTDQSGLQALQANGAIFQDQDVVVDGKIITAAGPEATDSFGLNIIDIMMLQ